MASVVYPKYKQALLTADANTDIEAGNVKVYLIDTADYTYSAAHDMIDDVAAAAKVATSGNLASKTITDGTFDAADITFSAVSGDQCEALIVFIDTGTASTSRLVCYIDSFSSGMPVTPNGGDITVSWSASGIFSL